MYPSTTPSFTPLKIPCLPKDAAPYGSRTPYSTQRPTNAKPTFGRETRASGASLRNGPTVECGVCRRHHFKLDKPQRLRAVRRVCHSWPIMDKLQAPFKSVILAEVACRERAQHAVIAHALVDRCLQPFLRIVFTGGPGDGKSLARL